MRRDVVTTVVLGVVLLAVLGVGGVVSLRKARAEREARLERIAELRAQIGEFKATHPGITEGALRSEDERLAAFKSRLARMQRELQDQTDDAKTALTKGLTEILDEKLASVQTSRDRLQRRLAELDALEHELAVLETIEGTR